MRVDEEESVAKGVNANNWGEHESFATVHHRLSTVDRDNSALWRNRLWKESQGAKNGKSDAADHTSALFSNEIVSNI